MAVFKCKMCGGDLQIAEDATIAECEYCGSKQTVPSADNEKKMTLFTRGNRLRLGCEFDKAAGIYEALVADFPEEPEAYWGLVLCKYGIEYVDDPATGKKVPTCHRSSFESVMDDPNFDTACEYANPLARRVYREEAKQIEEIRKGIIEVSGKEEPYDIFICYKETDENGERTLDSVLAQDVYDTLTEKDYRVFFARITLEDKLGQEYEPYIFAALNSAKVMLVFGTDYEYFNAVWVKNEWSRYLQLMTQDKTRHLIPCYKGIDAYDMPKEFAKLQAQDMGKVGAVQDLLRGIEKLMPKEEKASPVVQQVVQTGGPNVQALLKRGNMALEDGEWSNATDFFDQVLNMDAECAEAYLGKALVDFQVSSLRKLGDASAYTPKAERLQAEEEEPVANEKIIEDNRAEIDAIFKKYGYGVPSGIKVSPDFDFGYDSYVSFWEDTHSQVVDKLNTDKNLMRAKSYAGTALKQEIEQSEKNISRDFQAMIEAEKQKDLEKAKQVNDEYKNALRNVLTDIIHDLQEKQHEADREAYHQAVADFAKAKDEWTLRNLRGRFIRLNGYQDSQEYAEKCLAALKAIETERKIAAIRTQIYTLRVRKDNLSLFDKHKRREIDAQIDLLMTQLEKM